MANRRELVDQAEWLNDKVKRQIELGKLGIQELSKLGTTDCENYAFTKLGLYSHLDEYGDFIHSIPFEERTQFRFIDFLLLKGYVSPTEEIADSTLLAYWHSGSPQADCEDSGLPFYSHFGICSIRGDKTFYESQWGIGGKIYRTTDPFDVPSLYGDRIHMFEMRRG